MFWRIAGWISIIFLAVSAAGIARAALLDILFPSYMDWSKVPR
jgi:hypothetical protein